MTTYEPAGLVRSDPSGPGIRRRRCGRGFRYFQGRSVPVTDPRTLARIKALVIPPAWQDVWICPEPEGHIQAVGTDAAGRRQYRYHDRWPAERDREKHARALTFGRVLPRVRTAVERDLERTGLDRERVLAAAIRLIDLGFFRAGGEEYAAENGTYGLATIRREDVVCSGGETARRRAIVRVVREVADYLGNTPAVARASYIDPRIIELYERGVTIEPALADLGKDSDMGELATRGRAEKAVLEILARGAGA